MPLIAAGRASEILDLGDGRVLRRFKAGGDPAREAHVMDHARAHGFPVPRVEEVRADALVLERIDGPTMWEDLRRRPWRMRRHAATLAELHRRLHSIPFEDAALLHLDLHPGNVILSPDGPVVIDWTNARSGDPPLDVALLWVLAASSGGRLGRLFGRNFLRHFDPADIARALPEAVAYRLADPNVLPEERERVRALTRSRRSGTTGE